MWNQHDRRLVLFMEGFITIKRKIISFCTETSRSSTENPFNWKFFHNLVQKSVLKGYFPDF